MTTVDRTNGNGMHVGVQYFRTTRHDLQFLRRHGGTHMDVTPDDFELTTLPQQRDEAATEGVSLEMIHILIPKGIPLAQDPLHYDDVVRASCSPAS